jgi:hypothetical protein
MTVGWLAREGKLEISQEKRTVHIRLLEEKPSIGTGRFFAYGFMDIVFARSWQFSGNHAASQLYGHLFLDFLPTPK